MYKNAPFVTDHNSTGLLYSGRIVITTDITVTRWQVGMDQVLVPVRLNVTHVLAGVRLALPHADADVGDEWRGGGGVDLVTVDIKNGTSGLTTVTFLFTLKHSADQRLEEFDTKFFEV